MPNLNIENACELRRLSLQEPHRKSQDRIDRETKSEASC